MMNFGYSEEGQQGSLRDFHLWQRILQFARPYKLGLGIAVGISLIITSLLIKNDI